MVQKGSAPCGTWSKRNHMMRYGAQLDTVKHCQTVFWNHGSTEFQPARCQTALHLTHHKALNRFSSWGYVCCVTVQFGSWFTKVPPSQNLPRGRLEEAIEEEVWQRVKGRGRRIHVLRDPHLPLLLHGTMSIKQMLTNLSWLKTSKTSPCTRRLSSMHVSLFHTVFQNACISKSNPSEYLHLNLASRKGSHQQNRVKDASRAVPTWYSSTKTKRVSQSWAPPQWSRNIWRSLTPKGLIVPSNVESHHDLRSFHTLKATSSKPLPPLNHARPRGQCRHNT